MPSGKFAAWGWHFYLELILSTLVLYDAPPHPGFLRFLNSPQEEVLFGSTNLLFFWTVSFCNLTLTLPNLYNSNRKTCSSDIEQKEKFRTLYQVYYVSEWGLYNNNWKISNLSELTSPKLIYFSVNQGQLG